ncbi:MAG: transcriptional regulator [Chloroflexi bacterium HGW-Chloroflexi-1]|nr:MAG: transcriptional regulator [Chloroflexi bacterium HGW-Chloroflexi-1]
MNDIKSFWSSVPENQTNFDQYLERKLQDPEFSKRFAEAARAWDVALQLAALREERGLTQQQVAEMLGTKQQAVARLENPSYMGHSLSMIRRYADALGAIVDVRIIPSEHLASAVAS